MYQMTWFKVANLKANTSLWMRRDRYRVYVKESCR